MNYPKLAFTNEDRLINLSPRQIIEKMFESTDEEGILSIPEWPYDNKDPNEPNLFYVCKMKWNKEKRECVIENFRKLNQRMKTIKEEEPLQRIIKENCDILPFSDMLKEVADLKELKKEPRPATYDVAIRAMRLCRLYTINGPEMIIRNEAQLLAQVLVINNYADSIQIIPQDPSGIPECH